MIKELIWDSAFFRRKIGELTITTLEPHEIGTEIEKAKADGFKYIIYKSHSQQIPHIKFLESLGFYLSDIGVTWAIDVEKFSHKHENSKIRQSFKIAGVKNIVELREIAKSLFIESRFYNDPFYSKEEADNLYQAWLENSVKGTAADIVLFMPDSGFITCKKTKENMGEIVLIGVKKESRGRRIGKNLVGEAVKWFKNENIDQISTRTQLKNLNAMNFYLKLGFSIKGYDIVFGKIL